jgi:hypothetical protein
LKLNTFSTGSTIGSVRLTEECVFPDGFLIFGITSRSRPETIARVSYTPWHKWKKRSGKAARARYPKESHCCEVFTGADCVADCPSIKSDSACVALSGWLSTSTKRHDLVGRGQEDPAVLGGSWDDKVLFEQQFLVSKAKRSGCSSYQKGLPDCPTRSRGNQ